MAYALHWHLMNFGTDMPFTYFLGIFYIYACTSLQNWLNDVEILATLMAALIHDFEHTGTTNNFHVMSGSETAILYNDRAVLENHHICAAFR